MLAFLFLLVLHVAPGESINAALDSARAVYAARGEKTTICIAPGTYQEELTIDIPGLKLKGTSKKQPAKITWYYGHGYQYKSMGEVPNYGGSRTRRWNASVLVTAPDFYAQNIIFENSFNLYVSETEAQDSLVDISLSDLPWTEKERPKKVMPQRPKEVGSTEVQKKAYRERAAAISFTSTATNAHLKNCRAVGRQDVLYGDQGASIYWEGGVLAGGVDFIFGAMTITVDGATIVANINGEKGDKCYISAGRSGSDEKGNQLSDSSGISMPKSRGMLFYKCHIRLATEDELEIVNGKCKNEKMVWLARPWRAWGETVWAYTTWDKDVLAPEGWSTGLINKREDYNPENPCPKSYEFRSQDKSVGRPQWVKILDKPLLPDGTKLTPKKWK